jgi:hypothetical protein
MMASICAHPWVGDSKRGRRPSQSPPLSTTSEPSGRRPVGAAILVSPVKARKSSMRFCQSNRCLRLGVKGGVTFLRPCGDWPGPNPAINSGGAMGYSDTLTPRLALCGWASRAFSRRSSAASSAFEDGVICPVCAMETRSPMLRCPALPGTVL